MTKQRKRTHWRKNLETEKKETAMERKIGEIFEYNSEWYQTVEAPIDEHSCNGCQGCKGVGGPYIFGGECDGNARKDGKFVIFKKLEKVGEPYSDYCPSGRVIYFQRYRCFQKPIYNGDFIYWSDDISISIEIKQNEKDVKEINNPNFSNTEKIGKNLKPFDLQAAKSGKPVCTRDGRKARIICFDAKGDKPIIALVEMGTAETPNNYPIDGKAVSAKEASCDLMMLPEKKEGWVNVYKRENEYIFENECNVSTGITVYKNEDEAKRNINENAIYLSTIKVTWEE